MTPTRDERRDGGSALLLLAVSVLGFSGTGFYLLSSRVLALAGASAFSNRTASVIGIALGGAVSVVASRILRGGKKAGRPAAWFGGIQAASGLAGLIVTMYLPLALLGAARWPIWAAIPAFLIGVALPLAAEALIAARGSIGVAVSGIVAASALGAVCGAVAGGFWLVRWLGIERSLQILTLLNLGTGLTLFATSRRARWMSLTAAAGTIAAAAVLALNSSVGRVWDPKEFAIFRTPVPGASQSAADAKEAALNTSVLFYAEGVESFVSVINVKGGDPVFLTDGRVEAPSGTEGQQRQFLLGHLPTLLARDPRQVLVVGLGCGTIAGSAAVHPSVERVTVIEPERQMSGIARAFGDENHHVLDSPKLRIVESRAGSFLLRTEEAFDVITFDVSHSDADGRSSEDFSSAAKHLRQGGIAAQWLPASTLSAPGVPAIVKSFQTAFSYTTVWRGPAGAVLVGGNDPTAIDERALDRRIAEPTVSGDLLTAAIRSAADLVGYFAMGTDGLKRVSQDSSIDRVRESVLPYLVPEADAAARVEQQKRAGLQLTAGQAADPPMALFVERNPTDRAVIAALNRLKSEYPAFAPGAVLWTEFQNALAFEPRLLQDAAFHFIDADGKAIVVQISAVLVPVSRTRASIVFVDNRARTVFGQAYLDDYGREGRAERLAWDVMVAVQAAYDEHALAARDQHKNYPPVESMRAIGGVIESKVKSASGS